MKKYLTVLFVLFIVLLAGSAFAANINFGWDANSEADLAGYRLYKSQTTGTYQLDSPVAEIPAGTEIYTLEGVTDGTYFFVLTAFDQTGNESGQSNEVSLTVDETAPAAPTGFWGIIQQIMSWLKGRFGGFHGRVG